MFEIYNDTNLFIFTMQNIYIYIKESNEWYYMCDKREYLNNNLGALCTIVNAKWSKFKHGWLAMSKGSY